MVRLVNDDTITDEDRAYARGYMQAARSALDDDLDPQPEPEPRRRLPLWVVAVVVSPLLVFGLAALWAVMPRQPAPVNVEIVGTQTQQQTPAATTQPEPEPTAEPSTPPPDAPSIDTPERTVIAPPQRVSEQQATTPAGTVPTSETADDPQPARTASEPESRAAETPDPVPQPEQSEPEPEPAATEVPEVATEDEGDGGGRTGLVPGLLCLLLCWD